MEPAICIETLFPDLSFEERLSRVAEHGFRCAEIWSWKDKDLPALARAADAITAARGAPSDAGPAAGSRPAEF